MSAQPLTGHRGSLALTVFGANGRLGLSLLREARERGHRCRAFVRPGSPFEDDEADETLRGDLTDLGAVAAAVDGADGVFCTFGPRPTEREAFCAEATETIVTAMRATGARRLICVTGAMIGPSTIGRSVPFALMARAFRWRNPPAAADREQQEAIVRTSGLNWTLVKPPALRERRKPGGCELGPDLRAGLLSSVSRPALAEALVDLVEQPHPTGESLVALGRRRAGASRPPKTATAG